MLIAVPYAAEEWCGVSWMFALMNLCFPYLDAFVLIETHEIIEKLDGTHSKFAVHNADT